MPAAQDPAVLALAEREERVLNSADTDFAADPPYSTQPDYGMLGTAISSPCYPFRCCSRRNVVRWVGATLVTVVMFAGQRVVRREPFDTYPITVHCPDAVHQTPAEFEREARLPRCARVASGSMIEFIRATAPLAITRPASLSGYWFGTQGTMDAGVAAEAAGCEVVHQGTDLLHA